MAMTSTIQKTVTKFSTKSTGILGQAASGIGTNRLMRFTDNVLIGGRTQSVFAIPIPFIGQADLIDLFNYIVHAGGFKLSKKGFVAVVSAKVEQGVLPLIPNLNLLGGSSPTGSAATGIQSTGAGF